MKCRARPQDQLGHSIHLGGGSLSLPVEDNHAYDVLSLAVAIRSQRRPSVPKREHMILQYDLGNPHVDVIFPSLFTD